MEIFASKSEAWREGNSRSGEPKARGLAEDGANGIVLLEVPVILGGREKNFLNVRGGGFSFEIR